MLNNFKYFINLIVAKCYCEHQDGAMPDNGILCSKGGNVERIAYCSTDEKCTGTTDPEATDAANETNYGVLCTKGKFQCHD